MIPLRATALAVTSAGTLLGLTTPPVTELNTFTSEQSSWLRADGLEVFFSRYVPNEGEELLRALRPSGSALFEAPEPVSELNSSAADSDPCLSADRRYIMFSRGPTPRNIYHAYR